MNNLECKNDKTPSIDELQKEIRVLKRKLALAEINLSRARQVTAAQDRVETVLNSSLKKELQFFQLVLENTTNILLLFDFDGRFAYASRTFLQDVGIANFGLINGRHYEEVFRPIIGEKSLSTLTESLNLAIAQKRTIILENQIDFNQKGDPRTFFIFITPMLDENSENAGIMALFNDITELRATMAKMREADELTQIMLDAMPLCANFWDKNLNNIDCNKEAVNLFGLSGKQEYLDRFFELSPEYQNCGTPSSEKGLEYIKKTFAEGFCRFEWMHQKLNGEPIPCEITLVRVKYKDDFIVAGYTRDLRELKAMISEMRRIEIAEESNKAKSKFLARMSHEIRTPMNAILGITEIQLQNESLMPNTVEALGKIYNSANTLLRIINDILDLSKIEAGKLELIIDNYEIANLLNDTAQLNIMRIDRKPIKFKLEVDENTPAVLLGDELRIKQILNNLLSNAFKYTEQGVVTLVVSPDFTSEAKNSEVTIVFRVSDTGQGMSQEQVNKLFNEYTRFNMEANRAIEGTGLGMNITQHLIKMMNGEISVESEIGKGSIFTVRLPQGNAGQGVLGRELSENLRHFRMHYATQMKKARIVRKQMSRACVLVVDDVDTNLYVAKGLLAPYGLLVDTATSGYEAIDKLKTDRIYDIVFMDHMMPHMDGIETTSRIRAMGEEKQYYKNVPIIALTANAISGTREMFLQNSFNDFLSKPVDILKLNAILEKWIPENKQDEAIKSMDAEGQESGEAIKIAGIDTEKGIEMSGGTFDNYLRTLTVFREDSSKKIIEIKDCLEKADLPLYTIHVHALKSASANVGANDISKATKILESAGKRGDLDFIKTHNDKFLSDLQALINAIDEAISARGSKKQSESIDRESLKAELSNLKSAMIDYDVATINEIAKNLQKFTQASGIGDIISKILQCELIGEYDEAVLMIDEILHEKL